MINAPDCRMDQLRIAHPEIGRYPDALILDAFFVDFVFGGAYAWAYLAKCAVEEADIQTILRTPIRDWSVPQCDIARAAEDALAKVGLRCP